MQSSLSTIALLSCLLCCMSGCIMEFTRELVSAQQFTVGNFTIEEEIYRTDSFPDAQFERIYHVESPMDSFALGRYSDEDAGGITTLPQLIGEWLVVMSGAHIFFWQAGQEIRHFYPFVVDEWVDYAQPRQLNGHYDYAAAAVEMDGALWRLIYTCTYCTTGQPQMIYFVSADGGVTFRIEGD